MGFGISLGGGSKKEKSEQTRTQDLTGTTNTFTDQMSRSGQTGTTQAAQSFWTPVQQNLANTLGGYLGGNFGSWGQSPQSQDAIAAMTRAATGQGYTNANVIDPKATEALYAAIEKQTMEDILPKATRALAGEANLAGMLRSGPALQMQLENRNQVVNQLMNTLAGLRYQDEQARRGIEAGREERREAAMLPGAQSLFGTLTAGPEQQNIQNILSLLGIRGATTETGRTDVSGFESQKGMTREDIIRNLYEQVKSKGKTSQMSGGLNIGL